VGRLERLLARYRRRRFAILFGSLLLTLAATPLLLEIRAHLDLVEVFLALNLLAALLGTVGETGWRPLAVLGVLFFASRGINLLLGGAFVLSASEIFWTTTCLLACAANLRFVLRGRVVDSEHIFAALGTYLLAGIVFGVAYHVLDEIRPGSLRMVVAEEGVPATASLGTCLYFSFVTLATLGYGDVVPATELTRTLATLEAVGAQLYLAVLIARLVGLYARNAE
jgi:hypothetical protein